MEFQEQKAFGELKRKYRCILSAAEGIHDRLAHEQPDRYANRDGDHSSSDINSVPIRGNASGLGESRRY